MSKLTKPELVELIAERNRRKLKAKPAFQPNDGQRPVMTSQALIRLVTSGNGAGKTALACVCSVWEALGHNPVTKKSNLVPTKIIYLLDRPGKVNDKIIPEMKKFFDVSGWEWLKDGTPHIRRIKFPNESEIIFMFHEQDAMAFESIDGYSLVVADEPPPRHCYIGLRRGGRSRGFKTRYLLIGTPIGPNSSWLRTELLEQWKAGDKDIEVFNFPTEVNKQHLEDGYIESFSKALSEKEKLVRLNGQWSDIDGLALAHLFDDRTHIIPRSDLQWSDNNPCVVAIDPHPSKAHVAVLLGVDQYNNMVVLQELAEKCVPRLFARKLREFMKPYRVIDIVCDSLGSSEMTGAEGYKSFIEVLREEGVRVRPTTYEEKSDAEWISRIQDSLLIPDKPNNFGQHIPKLRISSQCRMVISDIKNVQWIKARNTEDYKPTLDISNKDALACVKYALACNLFFNKPRAMEPHYINRPLYGVTPPAPQRVKMIYRRPR